MSATFTLAIDLGNEAMDSAQDVAEALEQIAARIREYELTAGVIRDRNGNTVGEFQYDDGLA